MGRIARQDILYAGCYAHVFTRAIGGFWIVSGQQDFEELKRLLLQAKKKFQFEIYHYCFMHTHFHVAVRVNDVFAFSKGLGYVKKKYAEWYNFKQKRFGPLWRDRFKSLLIEDEKYLYACGLYIERNPVKAGMVNKERNGNTVLVDATGWDKKMIWLIVIKYPGYQKMLI